MAERSPIGQILLSHGRVTVAEVARALEYQRENGGYFGEALIALGLLTRSDLESGLASQDELPFVLPDADTVDPEAAALVSPEWALAHVALPIKKTPHTLTVLIDSSTGSEAVEELEARTGLEVQLARGGSSQIRELIWQVFAAHDEGESPAPVDLSGALLLALDAAAPRCGISSRKAHAWFWYDDAGTVRRSLLEGMWETQLDELLDPPPSTKLKGKERATFKGKLNRRGTVTPVEVRYLADESGAEYLFEPSYDEDAEHRFPAPAPGVLSAIRVLSRSGSARFIVTATPDSLGHEILPHLPSLLLDASWRSIYVNAVAQKAASEAFSVQMPKEAKKWASELETLRSFRFDVVTVDLTGNAKTWAASALDVARVAFLLWPANKDRRPAWEAGIRWELRLEMDGDRLDWSLHPLNF